MVQPSAVIVLASRKAGNGRGRDELPRLMRLLDQAGLSAVLTEDVAQACAAPDDAVVVAAGGDGTITLAASHLRDRPDVCLVALPLGTENLLARHFGYQADATQVLHTIQHGKICSLDLGRISNPRKADRNASGSLPDRCMLTMVSCGFDAEVVRRLHLRRRGHIRRSSYLLPIYRVLGRYRFPELTVETLFDDGTVDQSIRCGWAMVFNLPCYGGGLSIHPDAAGSDGKLDVIAFKGRTITSGLRYLAAIKAGVHFRFSDVIRCQASRIRIGSLGPVAYQVDGDYAGRLPIEIRVRPAAVKLLLPPQQNNQQILRCRSSTKVDRIKPPGQA